MNDSAPCVLFEDEHLLVVNKPSGWNTHAPSPWAGEGIYEWLRRREPRWAALATMHRLDKETSGVLVFSKTTVANHSLTAQFAKRQAHKGYLLLTDREPPASCRVDLPIVRDGDRYATGRGPEAQSASTIFTRVGREGANWLVRAEPLTGRTHQIRVHASHSRFPILGDTLYGGSPSGRICLHAAELRLKHPSGGRDLVFEAAADFSADAQLALRKACIDPTETDCHRLLHGGSDHEPGLFVDRFGESLLAQTSDPSRIFGIRQAGALLQRFGGKRLYHKPLHRTMRDKGGAESAPRLLAGEAGGGVEVARENGVKFEIRFGEGYSVGVFPDQRENRRRVLTGHVCAGFTLGGGGLPLHGKEVLNTFAYSCGFSVCAAMAGARATSLDLSRHYLDWGRRNMELNGIDASAHDFIYGEAREWMRRLQKKGRRFDLVILDPPTFSQSREEGTFQVEKDFPALFTLALGLLNPGGTVLSSTNAAKLDPEGFVHSLKSAAAHAGRRLNAELYLPQPVDFPISKAEPAYFKSWWSRFD